MSKVRNNRLIYCLIQRFLRSFVTCHVSLVTRHVSLVTCHSSLVTRHLSLVTRHLSLGFLLLPTVLFAQLSAGPNVTINPGVPVTLTAKFGDDLLATPITLKDDDITVIPNPIEFPFKFYGNIYTDFFIGSNGWISFTYNTNWARGRPAYRLPSNDQYCPKNCILGPMQDYNPASSQSPYIFYKTIGTTPNRKLVVMWCQTPISYCPNDMVTFQIILNEKDNSIESHVFSKPLCDNPGNAEATLGIQDENGYKSHPIPGYNFTQYSLSEQSWKYTPIPDVVDDYTIEIIPPPFELLPITPSDKISYAWYQGSELISSEKSLIVTPDATTTYTAWCTICNGATFSSTVTVTLVPLVPDAFTPNNDGANDTFDILGLPSSSIADYHIEIYNRWGQQVFAETDITKPWNGKMNNAGEICPDGVYVWVIYYLKADKTKVSNKGTVTLLR